MRRILIGACLLAAACGDGGDGGTNAGGGGGAGTGGDSGTGAAPTAFKDMTFVERYAFMTEVVMPQMTETFAAFDPKYESMTCETCHGDGARDGTFKMPTAQIAVLPGTEEGFLEWVAEDPERERWSTFMYEEVVPQIASLLQVERYDSETNTGEFSCHNCHTLEGVEP